MNRILILGSQFELSGLVKKAKARGCYTVVADGYPDGEARAFADKCYTVDVRDYDAVAEICRLENIDHIATSYSDILFEAWANIAERAGIPCYVPVSSIPSYRDKTVMKKNLEMLGIGAARYVVLRSDFADSEIANIRFPAVLKPIDSCGSRGLHVVYVVEEVRKHFLDSAKYTGGQKGAAILEELCTGQELNCQACVVDGEVKLISIADRMTGFYRRDTIPINYANIYPSHLFAEVKDAVVDIFSRYADFTGQLWGPIAMQCFWDGTEIRVCEITGRFFGYEHELVEYSNGLDLDQVLLDLQYDKDALRKTFENFDPVGTKCAIGIYETVVGKGRLADQSSLIAMQTAENVKESVLFLEIGTEVDFFLPKQYAARYYLVGENQEKLTAQMEKLVREAAACGEDGQNLLYVPGVCE